MKNLKDNKGYTLIELLTVVVIILIIAFTVTLLGVILTGNQWCAEAGVLKDLQMDQPQITSIKIERKVFSYSEVTAKYADGHTARYSLDTNILFNYKFWPWPRNMR